MRIPAKPTRLFACSAALAALVAACGGAPEEAAIEGTPVTVARVESRDIDDKIDVTGQLIARNQATIAAEVAGRITRVVLDEGEFAEDRQIVLEIDTERRQLDLANAAARLAEAQAAAAETQREVKRIRKLHARNVASQAQLDTAETQARTARSRVAAAEAQHALAERALADSTVTAPFAGSIARRQVSEGEFVNTGQPLFELVAVDPIEVEFHVAEADSGRIELGQEALVQVSPYPDELFDGRVTVVSPTIDSRTRTLRVRAELSNHDGRLRPGLFARVKLGLEQRQDVTMIPEEAVLQRADGPVVYRLNGDGRAHRIKVELGTHEYGAVEVRHGLREGDRVVTRGHAELADGSLVAIRNPDGTAPEPVVAAGAAGGTGASGADDAESSE